jgi:hypothetical protein
MDLALQNLPNVSIGIPTFNWPEELRRVLKAVVKEFLSRPPSEDFPLFHGRDLYRDRTV